MVSNDIPSAAKALRDQLTGLQPELAKLRLTYLGVFLAAALALTVIITMGLLVFYPYAEAVFPLAISLPLLLSALLFRAADRMYRKKARQTIIETLTFSSGFHFRPSGFATLRELSSHAIWPQVDSADSKDAFDGSYNNVPVALQDVILTKNGRSRGGIIVRLMLKRPVDGHTVVVSRQAVKPHFQGRFDNYGKVGAPGVFDKQVDVFSTERTEARLLADTAFLERLTEAGKTVKARWLAASFQKSTIVFFMERQGSLANSPPLWQSVGKGQLLSIYEQFEAFFKLVDTLRANRQLHI
jgi:hypothetical protein